MVGVRGGGDWWEVRMRYREVRRVRRRRRREGRRESGRRGEGEREGEGERISWDAMVGGWWSLAVPLELIYVLMLRRSLHVQKKKKKLGDYFFGGETEKNIFLGRDMESARLLYILKLGPNAYKRKNDRVLLHPESSSFPSLLPRDRGLLVRHQQLSKILWPSLTTRQRNDFII